MNHRLTASFRIAVYLLMICVISQLHADELDDCVAREMEAHSVPGLSLAIVRGRTLVTARAYGNKESGVASPMTTETRFQAASISKTFAALGALLLVQDGKLSLDDDVNRRLKEWKIPENEFTKTEKVTLRRILSHTGGLSVHGFGGYPKGLPLPKITETLDGQGTANHVAIRVIGIPGSQWKYSGGGYVVLQKLMSDATGEPFSSLLEETVLKPLQMKHSTFAQPLPSAWEPLAAAGHRNGKTISGRWHVYPEQAAAGLWTTPSDLALMVIALQKAKVGDASGLIKPATAKLMLTPVKNRDGLGLFSSGPNNEIFWHGGRNAGFDSMMRASATDGVIVMINANDASGVANRVCQAAWNSFILK